MWFGDVPLSEWKPLTKDAGRSEPWSSFERARLHLAVGDRDAAVSILRKIADTPELESKQHLQAWAGLRELGVMPPPERARLLYGVIVEVHQSPGLDILAAYADRTARYFNYSGSMIVWEAQTPAISRYIGVLLSRCETILPRIGPWEGLRPSPPPQGQVRINLLTASGLHFGQGSREALAADGLGGPPLGAATDLMKALVEHADQSRNS
jgi:hypothetical protein